MKSLFRAASMAAALLISGCEVMPKRPPYPDPGRLVSLVKVSPEGEQPILNQDFLVLRSESKTLEPIAAYIFRGLGLTEGEPERIHSAQVTADFFSTLGVKPILGRALLPAENQPDSNPVVVISHTLWQRRFGGDPHMIGRKITLDQAQCTVVGIMPTDFRFPKDCDAWTPLASDFQDVSLTVGGKRIGTEVEVFARLKPGVTLQQAQADISLITPKLEGDYAGKNTGGNLNLTALRESRRQIDNAVEIKISRPAKPPVETGKEK